MVAASVRELAIAAGHSDRSPIIGEDNIRIPQAVACFEDGIAKIGPDLGQDVFGEEDALGSVTSSSA